MIYLLQVRFCADLPLHKTSQCTASMFNILAMLHETFHTEFKSVLLFLHMTGPKLVRASLTIRKFL